MEYFIIKPAVNTKETGSIIPQVQKMAKDYDFNASNSVYGLSKTQEIPDFEPNLDYFIVQSSAKLTDLLSTSMLRGGYLLSKQLKDILQGFQLPSHKFYPAKVSHKGEFYEFYCLKIISDFSDYVDYEKSSFFVYLNYAHNLGDVHVSSKEELIEKRKKLKSDNAGKTVTIWANKILMLENFDRGLDMFEIGMFDANTYVSQKLKDAITSNNITGCDISNATHLQTLL